MITSIQRPRFSRGAFHDLSLVKQFLLVGSLLVIVGLGVLGMWVSQKIEQIVVSDVSSRAASYIQGAITPHLQDIPLDRSLPTDVVDVLDAALGATAAERGTLQTKLWALDGTIIYDTEREQIGSVFPIESSMRAALRGQTSSSFVDTMHNAEHDHLPHEAAENHIFEIYVPIYRTGTNEVIAIAEFYENADDIWTSIRIARLEGWTITGLVGLILVSGLYTIVGRGSELIESQRKDLDQQVHDLRQLLSRNEQLQHLITEATQRSTHDYEAHLRRIGADLHDGVAQLLTLVLLKLDGLFEPEKRSSDEYEQIKSLLEDAMTELRDTATGLALPEIERLSLSGAVELIVTRHQKRTQTDVTLSIDTDAKEPPLPLKLCLCRVIQEALTNAFKHAGGTQQSVTVTSRDNKVDVQIADRGPGMARDLPLSKRQRLGLTGIRNRLETLGGTFSITNRPRGGTLVTATLPLTQEVAAP